MSYTSSSNSGSATSASNSLVFDDINEYYFNHSMNVVNEELMAKDAEILALVDIMGNDDENTLLLEGNLDELARIFDQYEEDFIDDEALNNEGEDALHMYRTVEAKFFPDAPFASTMTREIEGDVRERVTMYLGRKLNGPSFHKFIKSLKTEWCESKELDHRQLNGKPMKGRKGRGKKVLGLYQSEIDEAQLAQEELEAIQVYSDEISALQALEAYGLYRSTSIHVQGTTIPGVHRAWRDVMNGSITSDQYDAILKQADMDIWKLKGYTKGLGNALKSQALEVIGLARRGQQKEANEVRRELENIKLALEADEFEDSIYRLRQRKKLAVADKAFGYLPDGWIVHIDDDNDIVYVNEDTGEETYNRPTLVRSQALNLRPKRNVVQDLLAKRLYKSSDYAHETTRLERLQKEAVEVALDLTYAYFNSKKKKAESEYFKEMLFMRNKLSKVRVAANQAAKSRRKQLENLFAEDSDADSIPSWFGNVPHQRRPSIFDDIKSEPAISVASTVSSMNRPASAPGEWIVDDGTYDFYRYEPSNHVLKSNMTRRRTRGRRA